MTKRTWILGASDPEMVAVESLLRECGETVVYALIGDRRVTAGEAYRADAYRVQEAYDGAGDVAVYLVECRPRLLGIQHDDDYTGRVVRIDHHRPGDPGFVAPPEDFLRASSLGQVIAELTRLGAIGRNLPWRRWSGPCDESVGCGDYWHDNAGDWYITLDGYQGDGCGYRVPRDLVFTAAADHCLGHAYAGRCPGVDPDELMRFRVEQRAKFQGRDEAQILADIAAAKAALEDADCITLSRITPIGDCGGCGRHVQSMDVEECDACECTRVRDVRGRHIPELPEAGTRYGIAYIADGLPDASGRVKTVCSGPVEVVRAFLDWAPRNGLVDCYGDPERGFAGAYTA